MMAPLSRVFLLLAALTSAPCISAQKASDCITCHPGSTKGLKNSLHHKLLDQQNSCLLCHSSALKHARSAVDPKTSRVAAGKVTDTSCSQCHQGKSYPTSTAAHAFHTAPRRPTKATSGGPATAPPAPSLAQLGSKPNFEWNGLASLGIQFLNIHGSRERYRTDYAYDDHTQLLLTEAQYHGRRLDSNSWVKTIDLDAYDVGRPYEKIRARFENPEHYRASSEIRRARMTYQASGDFHRIDRHQRSISYDLLLYAGEDLEVFTSFENTKLEGYWLTNRIGNQNLTPLGSISSVSSPRRLDENQSELGFTLGAGQTNITVAAQYLDQRENNSWFYSQTATANPNFTESEDSKASNSLEGPGGRFHLAHQAGPLALDLQGRAFDRRRRTVTGGTIEGYDIASFTTTNTGLGEGSARTYLLDGGLTYDFDDNLALHSEWRFLDHKEHLFLDQQDITVIPSLATTVTVLTQRNQRTSSRLREGSAELEWQAHKSLWITGGWGWSQEKLRLPDLSLGDPDITSGTVIERGYLSNIIWRPTAHWSVHGHYRDFGQGGMQLTDIVDHHTRGAGSELKYRDGSRWFSLKARHRRSQNPVADSRTSNDTYTLSGGYSVDESLHSHLSYNLAQINSRTRTNFYFSPSTNPTSTLVGFHGESHSASGGLDWQATERLQCSLQASYTKVQGDYELDLYNWSADASLQLTPRSSGGLKIDQIDYREASNPDDYSAWSVLFYVTTKLSGSDW